MRNINARSEIRTHMTQRSGDFKSADGPLVRRLTPSLSGERPKSSEGVRPVCYPCCIPEDAARWARIAELRDEEEEREAK